VHKFTAPPKCSIAWKEKAEADDAKVIQIAEAAAAFSDRLGWWVVQDSNLRPTD
jgi:hypothetical protein